MIELYKNIKELREQKGLSQDELAKLTGYTSRSSIAKIEKGEVDLTRSKIIAFAKALDTTPTQLMGWEKKEWDKESQQFEDKINALYYQLRGLGWTVMKKDIFSQMELLLSKLLPMNTVHW